MRTTDLLWDDPLHQERPWSAAFAVLAGQLLCGFAKLVTSVRVEDPYGALAPSSSRQRIYIANHTSHADFLLLWAALPPVLRVRTRPVAAADYWLATGLRRYFAERVFRSVLVDREHPRRSRNPLHPMLAALDDGDSLIQFPEGTRGNGASVGQFRCGIYHLLRARPDVEVVPVWIHNLHRVFPRGALLPVPLPCSVRFGRPVAFDASGDKAAFLERLRAEVLRLGKQCR